MSQLLRSPMGHSNVLSGVWKRCPCRCGPWEHTVTLILPRIFVAITEACSRCLVDVQRIHESSNKGNCV